MAFYQVDTASPVQAPNRLTDWLKCVLCQTDTDEKLRRPEKNTRGLTTEGYLSLSSKLQQFAEIDSLPFDLDLDQLAGGEGLLQAFITNQACWHKSCYSFCSTSRLERAKKRRRNEGKNEIDDLHISPVKTRKSDVGPKEECCMFCGKLASAENLGPLCKVLTKETSDLIRNGASYLCDSLLMSKCSGTFDLMADDSALYHKICHTEFRNRVRSKQIEDSKKEKGSSPEAIHALALTELISYIDNVRKSSLDAPIFKLCDLAKRYDQTMSSMGVEYESHTSRLKEKLLQACPFLEASGSMGKDVIISYKSDLDHALRSLATQSRNEADLHTAANSLRSAIFSQTPCPWTDMSEQTQKACVPETLKKFVKMCLDGPKSVTDNDQDFEQEVMTIAQLIYYHASKRRKGNNRRHDSNKETPVVVYMSMKIYGSTRKKELVDMVSKAGLGISYDRVQTHLTKTAIAVCGLAQKEGAVCPVSLKKGVFTTAATDNIDHNTSSTTAMASFHGTAISLVQHPESADQGNC